MEVPTIYMVYVRAMVQRIYPQFLWPERWYSTVPPLKIIQMDLGFSIDFKSESDLNLHRSVEGEDYSWTSGDQGFGLESP